MVLGIGTGNPAHGDAGWRAVGVPFRERGIRTDEALRLLPGLVTGRSTALDDDLDVTLTPAAAMPDVLIGGNGSAARRRVAAHGDGWVSIGLTPEMVSAGLVELSELAGELGRPAPTATVVAPPLDQDDDRATAQLAAYAEAGATQVVLPPTGPRWEDCYERAARLRAGG